MDTRGVNEGMERKWTSVKGKIGDGRKLTELGKKKASENKTGRKRERGRQDGKWLKEK